MISKLINFHTYKTARMTSMSSALYSMNFTISTRKTGALDFLENILEEETKLNM